MTIVEFFDKSPIYNVLSALLCRPERVIFLGKEKKKIERAIERYRRVLEGRGIEIELLYRPVSKNALAGITEVLETVLDRYDDVLFDLTGGSDLELVAVGIISERHKGRVKTHRFNIHTGQIIDTDLDGEVCSACPFDMTVEENIIIHGGEPLHMDGSNVAEVDWVFDGELCETVDLLWGVSCEYDELWNGATSVLAALNRAMNDPMALRISVEPSLVYSHLSRVKMSQSDFIGFMQRLSRLGIIRSFFFGAEVSFTYSSMAAKKCLSISGQILELRIAARLEALTGEDGKPLYHSTRLGVTVDMSAEDSDREVRVINEIDVITMKDAIPVFISCKNGQIPLDEFYKLNAVAEMLGSDNAKKVLIATGIEGGIKGEHIRARAEAMGVRLIENAHTVSTAELDRILRSLWLN